MSGPIGSTPQPKYTNEEKLEYDRLKKAREETLQQRAGRSVDQEKVWCTCINCIQMPLDVECFCCNESKAVKKVCQNNQVSCIIKHPQFGNVVTNIDILNIERVDRFIKGDKRFKSQDRNDMWRYLSYRQYNKWWISISDYESIKPRLRFVVPACVVNAIRTTFPSENGQYVGHRAKFGQNINFPP
jgi:hypothetical protein